MSTGLVIVIAVVAGLSTPVGLVATFLLAPKIAERIPKLVSKTPKPVVRIARVALHVGEILFGLFVDVKPR